jgi:PAS domain S-box-containing protein
MRYPTELVQLLATALEVARQGAVITDHRLAGEPIVYTNPAFSRITGYDADEARGRNCSFLQENDRAQDAVHRLREAIAAGQPLEVVLRNYRKNGEAFWNRLWLAPITDCNGRATHYVGLMQDASDEIESL